MKTIFKTKLEHCYFQTVELPQNFNILHLDKQDGVPCIWYECDSDMPIVKLGIYCVGTGWRMDDEPPMKYIGTIQQDGLVWHYYRALSWRR
ncbi:MAG: hypothetical protein IJ557_02560 [Bacteroidaceae bacterium]|nr:hypothetical protein [Bacteroidaceae bacterium]